MAKDLFQVLQDVVCMLCNLLASSYIYAPGETLWRRNVSKTILTTTILNRPGAKFVISQLYE
jgi:hypothetical protein